MPRVDDRSGRITKMGYWEEDMDRGRTVTSAWDSGSQGVFTFKGTRVAVYGIIPDGDGEVVQVDFELDNTTAITQRRTSGRQRVFDELWWESDALPDVDHRLVMTYLRVNNADMDFRLDYIEYSEGPDSSTSSSIPTTASGSGTQVVGSTPTSDGSNGDTSSSKSQAPVGTIVGGVLGGMLVIVLAILAFLLYQRRRRRAEGEKQGPVSPYAVPSQCEPSASSSRTTKLQLSQVAPPPATNSSIAGTAYATSDSGLSYQTGPASADLPDHANVPDLPPPAYDSHESRQPV